MARLPPTTTTHHHYHRHQALAVANCYTSSSNSILPISFLSSSSSSSSNHTSPSPIHLHRSFLPFRRANPIAPSRRSFAASPGAPPPPPTPESEPPFDEKPSPYSGFDTTLSRFQDRVQIFFAVLFWMSLFFWACAWDGKDDGRPNKGSRFGR